MGRYHFKTKEAAERAMDRELAVISWVQKNLKPGMKCRFQGSRSNTGENAWREVLDVRINPKASKLRKVYDNKDYVAFKYEGPYRWGHPGFQEDYDAKKAEFRKIHPETESYFEISKEYYPTGVVSKNVKANEPEFASLVVVENDAVFLMEVEIDGVWVKTKDLLK